MLFFVADCLSESKMDPDLDAGEEMWCVVSDHGGGHPKNYSRLLL